VLVATILCAGPCAAAAAQLGLPHEARVPMIDVLKKGGHRTYKVRLVRVIEREPRRLIMRREKAGYAALELKSLAGTTFVGADFAATDLSGLDFSGSRFIGCDFSRAKVVGARWKGATYTQTTRWPVRFDPAAQGARLDE
jgi:hypothetical protein